MSCSHRSCSLFAIPNYSCMTPFPIGSTPGIIFSMAGRESRNPDKVSLEGTCWALFQWESFQGRFSLWSPFGLLIVGIRMVSRMDVRLCSIHGFTTEIWAVLGQIIKGCFISSWKQWSCANTKIKKVRAESVSFASEVNGWLDWIVLEVFSNFGDSMKKS